MIVKSNDLFVVLLFFTPEYGVICSDGVSRLDLDSRPIFASLGLEGFRSQDFENCKEMVY